MKILLTGASGFLGWHAAQYLVRKHTVTAIAHRYAPVIEGVQWITNDLTENTTLDKIFEVVQPDIVIHTAALTSVKQCKLNHKEAIKLNVKATERIAAACEKFDSHLIYSSTDIVFDGSKGNYTEDDPTNPVSLYGKTKRIAEEIIQSLIPSHTIVRFSLLYGEPSPYSSSFLSWMEKGFRNNERVTLFSDQFRTPLYVGDAIHLFESVIENKDTPPRLKLLHAGGPERLSRVEFGQVYCDVYGFDKSLIREIKISQYEDITNNVRDASLNSEKAKTFLSFNPRTVRIALNEMKNKNSKKRQSH